MKASMRARRMARNHRRMTAAAKLTLVPIIDIFTMLLFFLMVNTGNVEVLELDKTIKLPDSTAQRRAEETVLIKVNADDIIVQGRKVASVADVLAANDDVIAPLQKELDLWASRKLDVSVEEKARGHAVTIMGDQKIPYRLLKRVMTTCAQADFRDISLAVAALPEGGTTTPGAAPSTSNTNSQPPAAAPGA